MVSYVVVVQMGSAVLFWSEQPVAELSACRNGNRCQLRLSSDVPQTVTRLVSLSWH